MNKNKAYTGLTAREYSQQPKYKEYYQQPKYKEYYQQPKIKAMKKLYDQQPKIKARRKQRQQIKMNCVCGKICSIRDYHRHTQCKKHTDFINQHEDLSELFQLEMKARKKTALASHKLNTIKL